MPGKQRDGSYHFYVAEEYAWGLEQPTTTRCFFCGETFTGTAAEGIAWHASHRKKNHSGAKDRGQAARRKAAKLAQQRNWA